MELVKPPHVGNDSTPAEPRPSRVLSPVLLDSNSTETCQVTVSSLNFPLQPVLSDRSSTINWLLRRFLPLFPRTLV